jgi:hypothetical protein
MSWDVMIFDFKGPPIPLDEVPPDYQPPVIGSADEVRKKISAHLPGTDWSDPTWGEYIVGEGFTIEFNMGHGQTIDNFMLHVRGGGDAIAAIMQFARPNGWSVFDCSFGQYLDPDNPSQSGWLGFQAYRDHVISYNRAARLN